MAAGAWAMLGSAACLTTFAISVIPAPVPDGRDIPFWLLACEALLAIIMVPACVLIPLPLLATVRRQLRRMQVPANWVTAWTITASAAVAVEGLFAWRLTGMLTTPYYNLPGPSWHALYFGIAFLAAGLAMIAVLRAAASRTDWRPAR
jgi:hypothetical protein